MLKPHWVRLGTSTQSGESSRERPGITLSLRSLSLFPSPLLYLHIYSHEEWERVCMCVCEEREREWMAKGRGKERACVIAPLAHSDLRVRRSVRECELNVFNDRPVQILHPTHTTMASLFWAVSKCLMSVKAFFWLPLILCNIVRRAGRMHLYLFYFLHSSLPL